MAEELDGNKKIHQNTVALRFVLVVFLASRLWTALFVYLGHMQRPFLEPVPGGWEGVANWWLNPWTTFDSYHFLRIAQVGYEEKTAVFFPFYSLLLRLAGSDPIAMAAWGIILSNLALAAGLYYFYQLTKTDFEEQTAKVGVALLAFFPMTANFSAVYTESLFFLCIVAAFYHVRTGRWGWAALWAALAALTRNSGPLIFVMLLIEYFSARRQGKKMPRLALLSTLAPLLAFLGVQIYLSQLFGSLAGVQGQSLFDRHLTWPWTPIWLDIENILRGGRIHLVVLLNIVVSLLSFYLVWRHRKWLPLSYSIFIIGINLMNLSYSRSFWPHTTSAVRYAMTTFPFTQMLAKDIEPILQRRLSVWLLAACYLIICAVMCWLFGRKSFNG